MQITDQGLVFSHSSLSLYRECPRKWWYHYMAPERIREPKTDAMAAGTYLCQAPIEQFEAQCRNSAMVDPDAYFNGLWQSYLAEVETDIHPAYNIDLAKEIYRRYSKAPVHGMVLSIEESLVREMAPGLFYRSIPDLKVKRDDAIWVWDIKLKTKYWGRYDYLRAYDDQMLGQAYLTGAEYFGQIRFNLDKFAKKPELEGPDLTQQWHVDPVLMEQWERETISLMEEIRSRLTRNTPFAKVDSACNNFNRECPAMGACHYGVTGAINADNRK